MFRFEQFTKEESDWADTGVVSFTVPLFIRLMEYAREDAKTDMDLHFVAEKAMKLCKDDEATLDMDDYKELVSKK